MRPAIAMVGKTFSFLTVVSEAGRAKDGQIEYSCRCVCGAQIVRRGTALRDGEAKSCGCKTIDFLKARPVRVRHGNSGKNISAEYRIWAGMLGRVRAKSGKSFKNYGQRGITVCERWHKFENFLADMGKRPDGMTLDRIDNDGNYEPGNCRWAIPTMQQLNRRKTTVNSSGLLGVVLDKRRGTWRAEVRAQGRRFCRSGMRTAEEASRAYWEMKGKIVSNLQQLTEATVSP